MSDKGLPKEKKGVKLPLIPIGGKQKTKVKEEGSPPRKPAGVKAESEEGNSENKQKFKFADLFKDEGMYHSVSEAPVMKVLKKGSGGLIRTPL